MSRRAERRRKRALADEGFCEGCGRACSGKSRSDAVRDQARVRTGLMA